MIDYSSNSYLTKHLNLNRMNYGHQNHQTRSKAIRLGLHNY